MGGATHQVTNQPPPLEGYNLFETDRPLAEAVRREGASWSEPDLVALGKLAGAAEVLRLGDEAQPSPSGASDPRPVRPQDRRGGVPPAWHRLLGLSVSHGIHALPWREPRAGAHAARAAMMIMVSEVEAGHGCPVSMTYAAVPALQAEPEVAAEWEPRLTSLDYDPRLAPPADKAGALCGMAMTEKQGGSDVRANTTRAEPLSASGEFTLTGHKWFCSAPMSDAFLVLAQAPAGLTCLLLPRILPDGTRNGFRIQRLKDKLGNRSNASAEIELEAAWARRVGEEGRGVSTIVEMVNHTRLDCVLGSTGILRRAVAEAAHHAAHRSAFGRLLIDQPLMRNLLADICVESEVSTLTAMRLARAVDEAEASEEATQFKRLAVAVGKYWVCKRTAGAVSEALECLGGKRLRRGVRPARLYRETPLNSIWEGSGNVIALDVLRILAKTPRALDAFLAEVELAAGGDRRLDEHVAKLRENLGARDDLETRARRITEDLALALQGSLVVRHAPTEVADAFCASRLGEPAAWPTARFRRARTWRPSSTATARGSSDPGSPAVPGAPPPGRSSP